MQRADRNRRAVDDTEAVDSSAFHLTGPTYTLDASPLARAIGATLAVVADLEPPRLQLEVYPTGLLIVGTDTYSLLTAWVPWPTGEGWEHTRSREVARPTLDDGPTVTYTVTDPEGDAARWATKYGKARRARDAPNEQATLDVGWLEGGDPQPPLGEAVQPAAIRLAGPTVGALLPATIGQGARWQRYAADIESARPSAAPIPMRGSHAAMLGRVANAIGVDRAFHHQTRALGGDRSAVTVVDFAGFPHVAGYIAAPRTP